jgi:hypothetical protein
VSRGIEAAGLATATVLEPAWRIPVGVEGRPAPKVEESPIVQHVTASAGYFEIFRARLLAGRFFLEHRRQRSCAVPFAHAFDRRDARARSQNRPCDSRSRRREVAGFFDDLFCARRSERGAVPLRSS